MNPEDHSGYFEMRANGASPESVFLAAEKQLDPFAAIRVVRSVFELGLGAAKEVRIRAHGEAGSLTEYQKQLLPSLEQALEAENQDQSR